MISSKYGGYFPYPEFRPYEQKNSEKLDLNLINEAIKQIEKLYLFSWDEIPRKDDSRLIEYLIKNFGINWITTAKIEKIGEIGTISISTENNSLSLRLNNEKTRVNLTIDDGRTDEFLVKKESGKLNIYKSLENNGGNEEVCNNELVYNILLKLKNIFKKKIFLEIKNIDPSPQLSKIVDLHYAIIMMSGTFFPLDFYELYYFGENERAKKCPLPNPFPRQNRLIIGVNNVDTISSNRDDPSAIQNYEKCINSFITAISGNVALFFTSNEMKKRYTKYCFEIAKNARILEIDKKLQSISIAKG